MKITSLLLLLCISCGSLFAQDSTLIEYKGLYKFREGSPTPSVDITIDNGALYANSSIGSASMKWVSKDTFSIPDHNGMAYFYRSDKGKVNSIKVEVADLVLEGDKENPAMALTRRKRVYYLSR
jgi:hypothetical protein